MDITRSNSSLNSVIGTKADDEFSNSLYGLNYIQTQHIHSIQRCYPDLSNGSTVASAAASWTLTTSYTEFMSSTITTGPFDIHMIHIGVYSSSGLYQINLYAGTSGAESLICQARFTRSSNISAGSIIPVITPLMNAGTRITSKLANDKGSANVTFSVNYHTY